METQKKIRRSKFESDWVTYTVKKKQEITKKSTDQVEQCNSTVKINACRFN